MNCPKCGSILNEIIKMNSREYHCPQCNYGVSAFVVEPIDEDETIYKMEVFPQDSNISQVQLISKQVNINLLVAKKMLTDGGILIEGEAKKIYDIRNALDGLNIKYSITPEFKW